jgi:uncharacterized MAPEG superfamily protein
MVSVNTILAGTVFAWFMLMILLRRLVLLIILAVVGSKKPPLPSRVPEDRVLNRRPVATSTIDTAPIEFTKDIRANRVIHNDAENDTYFLILLLATAAFSDSSNPDCVRTIVYATIYLFFRIMYATAYIMGLQPWRTLAFFLGFACTLACCLDLVITMSRRSN